MTGESFEHAFVALFADQSARLYGYFSRLSGDAELAEDIVQECFVKLHQRGAMPEDPKAWLVTVAHNLWRDDRRRETRRGRLLLTRGAELPSGEPPAAPDAATLAAERVGAVRRALARLTLRDRQLLLLRHEGYGYREIADVLQLPPSGIGTMLARAMDAFRKAYHELFGAST